MIVFSSLTKSGSRYEKPLTALAERLLKSEGLSDYCIEVFIVSDEKMNKNVLAYPASTDFPRPDLEKPTLGEIYLNPDYIARHDESFIHMFIHGFLHLRGYDHQKKSDRIEMEAREDALITSLTDELPEMASLL